MPASRGQLYPIWQIEFLCDIINLDNALGMYTHVYKNDIMCHM